MCAFIYNSRPGLHLFILNHMNKSFLHSVNLNDCMMCPYVHKHLSNGVGFCVCVQQEGLR